jgi:hypothetical protein
MGNPLVGHGGQYNAVAGADALERPRCRPKLLTPRPRVNRAGTKGGRAAVGRTGYRERSSAGDSVDRHLRARSLQDASERQDRPRG